jgi:hypothetical protein
VKQQRWDTGGEWQETDLESGWTVREDFTLEDGRRIVETLTIRPTGAVPAGGITARLLRLVKVGQVGAGLRMAHAMAFGAEAAARLFEGMGWVSRPRRRGRRQRLRADDTFYAELARDYVEWWQNGDEKKPTAKLAERRGVPSKLMRSHINLARRNGFLTETSRGKAGGQLTEKARRTLAQKAPGRKKR